MKDFSIARKCSERQAGFTLLELMVVACVVGVLAMFLLNRVQFYQRAAEKVAMEQVVGALQSALDLRFAALITKERLDIASDLAERNPFDWLVRKPPNYDGAYFNEPEDIKSGHWYFDLNERTVIYLVHNGGLKTEKTPPQLKFKVKVVSGGEDFPEKYGSIAGKTVEGVVLEQIVPYSWD